MINTLNTLFKEQLKYGINEDDDLKEYIQEGIYYIENLTGTTIDFNENLFARTLLRDYVRYAVNHGAEYFEENFAGEILRLQLLEGVGRLESKD